MKWFKFTLDVSSFWLSSVDLLGVLFNNFLIKIITSFISLIFICSFIFNEFLELSNNWSHFSGKNFSFSRFIFLFIMKICSDLSKSLKKSLVSVFFNRVLNFLDFLTHLSEVYSCAHWFTKEFINSSIDLKEWTIRITTIRRFTAFWRITTIRWFTFFFWSWFTETSSILFKIVNEFIESILILTESKKSLFIPIKFSFIGFILFMSNIGLSI